MRLSLSIVTTGFIIFQVIFASPIVVTPVYTPDNLIIATDLDEVILRRRYGAAIFSLLKYSPGLLALYPSYSKNKAKYKPVNSRWGEGFYNFLQDQKEHKTATKTVKMLNQKKRLHKKTVDIYKQISAKGYQIYTATNIDTISFGRLQKQFPKVFNDSFIQHGMTVDISKKDVIKKPDLRYFYALSEKLNPNNDKLILFIDDLLENVEAARAASLLAIQYKNHKQLKKDLATYGITII